MTNEEALNICRLALRCFKNRHSQIRMEDFATQIVEENDLNTMMNAFEKQIPKKPDYKETNFAYKRIDCQICHAVISFQMPNERPKDINYCCKCGQALDWSYGNAEIH